MDNIKVGDLGTYNAIMCRVTNVNSDGTLNLQSTVNSKQVFTYVPRSNFIEAEK